MTDTIQQIRNVKRLLRASMSGPVSASMRAQGHTYKLNFGVDQPRLLTIANEIRTTIIAPAAAEAETTPETMAAALAGALWKEDIRECRLLACMLMPATCFDEQLAAVWIEQLHYAEEAQALAMHLLPRIPYAGDLAFGLISRERTLDRLTGWLLLGRLFQQGNSLAQRDSDEMLDHALCELQDQASDVQLRQTVLNALNRYTTLGEAENARGERVLSTIW